MGKVNYKIGFSEIGGIYIGKNIQSDFSKHYAITVLISFGEPFVLSRANLPQESYHVAIIQKNISFNIQSSKNEYVAFIHIVPYSDSGIKLSNRNGSIEKFGLESFEGVISEIKKWFYTSEKATEKVAFLLNLVSSVPKIKEENTLRMDQRIRKSFDLIMQNETEKLLSSQIASQVHLSNSHFARLFRKETGMTFRRFFLHSKLIKSIYAMYENNSLTEAAFKGGFSDQPHFTRTFKSNFGIKPSKTRK